MVRTRASVASAEIVRDMHRWGQINTTAWFMQGDRSDHGGLVTSDQEQQKFLDEASTSVKRNAFFMKKALV